MTTTENEIRKDSIFMLSCCFAGRFHPKKEIISEPRPGLLVEDHCLERIAVINAARLWVFDWLLGAEWRVS